MNDLHSPATSQQPDEEFLGRLALALEGAADRDAVVQRFADERPELASEVRELANLEGRLMTAAAPIQQLRPGDRLGEFRIVRLIAVGGMGEVYEAEQESLVVFQPNEATERRRRVAIKVIRRGQISDEYRARFLREQAVLARLHQTHVVPVHTAGEQEGIAYFAMPYIQGAALNHVLDATYNETKARNSTPTLGDMASRIAPSDAPKNSSGARPLIPTGTFHAAKAATPSPRRSLGQERVAMTLPYLRSVAAAMAEAAEAVQHVHDAQIVHRDLKPSNIMVDADGHCWIIDFGLAGAMPPFATTADVIAETQLPGLPSASHNLHTLPGLLGTIPYLAPEQLDGHADARSDVYGLGATLYELCTWRPPFAPVDRASVHRIRTEAVRPPRELATGLPVDLGAICLKALAKSPERRYQTARDLSADLRRWLNHEPTVALRARAPRRAWLWSRRNPGWAAALATLLLVLLVAVYAQATLLVAARTRELLADIERKHSAPKQDGWFETFWQLARQSAAIDPTVELRSLAATGLAGPDARLQHQFPIPASSVAFDRAGKRLLFGGTAGQPTQLWDGTLHPPVAGKQPGAGPVAFAADGTPLQLVRDVEGRLVLWNVASNELLREFKFPDAELQASALELSPDGRLIGACGQSANGKRGLIAVWNRESGELVLRLERSALSLAFAPDGSLLAAGDQDGRVAVWRVSDGTPVIEGLSADRAGISALAFGRDPRTAGQPGNRWLLAAGDDGGTITIWDLDHRLRAFCRGSSHHIHSIEFSPDGVTLGSVGRGEIRLWDTTTGRLVLSVHERNWMTDLAFSPDGMSVALSSLPAFDDLGRVSVWKLEPGRGIQTFRGLGQPIATAIFSPDERYVAAIAHDSRVGVWDRQTERLMHVFEAPKSLWVDNAALMFSPDSKLLACSGSSERESHARLWDISSGQEVAAWTLAPGLNHFLAFPREEELLLFQVELQQGGQFPDGGRHPRDFPRVGRLYDLRRGQAAQKRRFEITEFQWLIEFPMMPEDGRFIAVKGLSGKDRPTGRRVKVFDTGSGSAIWSGATDTEHLDKGTSGLMLDRSGKFLTDESKSILELPSGKFLEVPPRGATDGHRWSPEMPFVVHSQTLRLSLIPRGESERVLDLDRDSKGSCVRKQLSPSGGLFVWGNLDGTVHVCDIAEVRRRLTEIGLGW